MQKDLKMTTSFRNINNNNNKLCRHLCYPWCIPISDEIWNEDKLKYSKAHRGHFLTQKTGKFIADCSGT